MPRFLYNVETTYQVEAPDLRAADIIMYGDDGELGGDEDTHDGPLSTHPRVTVVDNDVMFVGEIGEV